MTDGSLPLTQSLSNPRESKMEDEVAETSTVCYWNSLVQRRDFLSLVECYKIVFNLNGLNFRDYFELCINTKSRSNHPYKLQTKLAKLNCYKNSFFVRIIKPWNDLPINVFNFRDSPNVSKFKIKIEESYEYLLNRHFIFIYDTLLFLIWLFFIFLLTSFV